MVAFAGNEMAWVAPSFFQRHCLNGVGRVDQHCIYYLFQLLTKNIAEASSSIFQSSVFLLYLQIDVGGVQHFMQDGIKVKYNFNGCIQNVNFNGGKLLADSQATTLNPSIKIYNEVGTYCGV